MHKELFQGISELAGLRFEINIPVIESKAVVGRRLKGLCDAKLIREAGTGGYDTDAKSRQADKPIADLLGKYDPQKNEIAVFGGLCEAVADSTHVSRKALERVVLAHQVTHAITHLGIDREGNIWRNFSASDEEARELLAHIYPLKYFVKNKEEEEIQAFRLLAKHQADAHNKWRLYEDKSMDEINQLMLDMRKRKPGIRKSAAIGPFMRREATIRWFRLLDIAHELTGKPIEFIMSTSLSPDINAAVVGPDEYEWGIYHILFNPSMCKRERDVIKALAHELAHMITGSEEHGAGFDAAWRETEAKIIKRMYRP